MCTYLRQTSSDGLQIFEHFIAISFMLINPLLYDLKYDIEKFLWVADKDMYSIALG